MGRFPEVGDSFGSYRLLEVLGRGSRGVAFEGFDSRLSRPVAVKILDPALAGAVDYRARFMEQAAAYAGLNSLHVTQLYDHGERDSYLFLVSPLVQGGDFASHLNDQGPLAPKVAISVVGQLCEGLRDIDAAGIEHRELRPNQVLVRDRGSVLYAYLSAFGVAVTEDVTKTAYMAPERHLGAPPDLSSALYSLGCLLWVSLTGTLPYQGSDVEIAMAHVRSPVPQLLGDGTDRINEVLARALAKDPADRYGTATEFATALASIGAVPPSVSPAAPAVRPPAVERVALVERVEPVEAPVPDVPEFVPVEPVAADVPAPEVLEAEVLEAEEVPEALKSWRVRRAEKRASAQSADLPVASDALAPDEFEADEIPEALKSWRVRRAEKRASAPSADRSVEPSRRAAKKVPADVPDVPAVHAETDPPMIPAARSRRPERPARDLSWLLPGALLLVLPVLALVGVLILFNGQGGSNFGQAATTPPQTISEGEGFSFGPFTAEAAWSIVDDGPLWSVSGLAVRNVSTQAEDAHFTLKIKKGANVLVALDCRTADLLPDQRQTVSCDDPANAAVDPTWDQITVEQAF